MAPARGTTDAPLEAARYFSATCSWMARLDDRVTGVGALSKKIFPVDTLFGNDRCETRLPKFHIGVLSNVLIDEQGMPLRWTSALALGRQQ